MHMKDDVFLSKYSGLNTEQKKAVDTIEGPVMVIAGPGTGKTSILTLRIANILRKTDTPANGILALTFTESGVHSMRKKLVEYLGSQAYRVHIYTFHGFAQEIITRYPEYFPRIIGGVVVSDSERYAMLENALFAGEYETIRPFGKPTLYVRKALSAIQDLKRDGVSPSDFVDILEKEHTSIMNNPDLYHEKGRYKGKMKTEYSELLRNNEKNRELASLYGEYEKELRARELYDYEDMLLELVRALKKHDDLLRTLQEEFLYILADEHQDANNSQNAILELLSDYRDTQNLFIVGDEKQAIYRFQGASLENFLYFQKKFPSAVVIFLDSNYRSTQTILDASHSLMAGHGETPLLRPRLTSASREKMEEKPVRITEYQTHDDELEGIASSIQKTIELGTKAEDIAVLVRTNAEISQVGRALQGFSIPHTLFTDDDVLKDSDIAKLMLLLRAVVYPEQDELIGSMLLIDFLGVHPVDAVKLNRATHELRATALEVLSHKKILSELFQPEAVEELSRKFKQWMVEANNESILDIFLTIVSETKFQEYLLTKQESLEKIEKLAKLYDEVKSFLTTHKDAKLKDFIVSLDTLLRHGGAISFSRRSLGGRGVTVMTAHKSKGLEWRHVFIVNVADKVWGNRRQIGGFRLPEPYGDTEEGERNEDEKRLFYVALTRAKELVDLSYALLDSQGKDRLISQFAQELPVDLVTRVEGESFGSSDRLLRAKVLRESDIRTIFDTQYLKEIFIDQGLNATALNNYLECPWKYFFKNLVRLPDAPEPYLHFGNAVHAALKNLADARREGKEFTEDDFLHAFNVDLQRRPLSKKDLAGSQKRGKKVLPVYFKQRSASWHNNSLTEYGIQGVHVSLTDGTDLLLRGRLDKVEILDSSHVNVVDYKTGKFKTRNEIEGKTKNSIGAIKRQLNFYRLLLELHDNGKFEMTQGTVEFVEGDEKDRIHHETFIMSHADALEVSQETVKAGEEILAFAFWDKSCGEKDCEFCTLKETLFGN